MTAVEKDRRLIKNLANKFPQVLLKPSVHALANSQCTHCSDTVKLQVNVIEANILTCDLKALFVNLLQQQG